MKFKSEKVWEKQDLPEGYCSLKITRVWGDYYGVGGIKAGALHGGKVEHKFNKLKNGDYIDMNFLKNSNSEAIKLIEIISVNENDVEIHSSYNGWLKVNYGETITIKYPPAADGPQYTDEITFVH